MRGFIFSLILVAGPVFANEQRIVCPERYPTADTRVPGTPNGWEGYGRVSGGLRLSGGGMIIGRPEDRGELRGSDRKTKGGHEIVFANLQNFDDSLQKWVYCGYGSGGEVQLLRRVGANVSQCRLRFTRVIDPAVPKITITCKGLRLVPDDR